jgi:hypothetical protein
MLLPMDWPIIKRHNKAAYAGYIKRCDCSLDAVVELCSGHNSPRSAMDEDSLMFHDDEEDIYGEQEGSQHQSTNASSTWLPKPKEQYFVIAEDAECLDEAKTLIKELKIKVSLQE